MIKDLLLVGFGGFTGSILRYLIGIYSLKVTTTIFPWGTLVVNLAGSLLIGLLAGMLTKMGDRNHQLLLMTGLCGGFTTFSTFSIDGIKLLREELYSLFALYFSASLVGGLLLCLLGLTLSHRI